MHLTLIDGTFSAAEAQELITRLVQVKLRFHEERIRPGSSEEDVHMREQRITRLQQELAAFRQQLPPHDHAIQLHALVELHQR